MSDGAHAPHEDAEAPPRPRPMVIDFLPACPEPPGGTYVMTAKPWLGLDDVLNAQWTDAEVDEFRLFTEASGPWKMSDVLMVALVVARRADHERAILQNMYSEAWDYQEDCAMRIFRIASYAMGRAIPEMDTSYAAPLFRKAIIDSTDASGKRLTEGEIIEGEMKLFRLSVMQAIPEDIKDSMLAIVEEMERVKEGVDRALACYNSTRRVEHLMETKMHAALKYYNGDIERLANTIGPAQNARLLAQIGLGEEMDDIPGELVRHMLADTRDGRRGKDGPRSGLWAWTDCMEGFSHASFIVATIARQVTTGSRPMHDTVMDFAKWCEMRLEYASRVYGPVGSPRNPIAPCLVASCPLAVADGPPSVCATQAKNADFKAFIKSRLDRIRTLEARVQADMALSALEGPRDDAGGGRDDPLAAERRASKKSRDKASKQRRREREAAARANEEAQAKELERALQDKARDRERRMAGARAKATSNLEALTGIRIGGSDDESDDAAAAGSIRSSGTPNSSASSTQRKGRSGASRRRRERGVMGAAGSPPPSPVAALGEAHGEAGPPPPSPVAALGEAHGEAGPPPPSPVAAPERFNEAHGEGSALSSSVAASEADSQPRERFECILCFSSSDVGYLVAHPCYHALCCYDCVWEAAACRSCPTCREPVIALLPDSVPAVAMRAMYP